MRMMNQPEIRADYWEKFTFTESDLDFLYNHLLEIETPLTTSELLSALIDERIRVEKEQLMSTNRPDGRVYQPVGEYQVGEELLFPAKGWKKGKVTSIRAGNNPEISEFSVIHVTFENGEQSEFAANLADHILNRPIEINADDPLLTRNSVLSNYKKLLSERMKQAMESNDDLVQIAGRWFPRALLVDVNMGYLNLAEAVLEMENGGPLTTEQILEQIDLPTDTNQKLTEFSLNYALQEDPRFDEVGPSGETLWFLYRMEPEEVKQPPLFLKYSPVQYNKDQVQELISMLSNDVFDELEETCSTCGDDNKVTLTLIYPHWQSGTLPLSDQFQQLFPTAYEAPRVTFTFIDGATGKKFSGWVVRKEKYVSGLKEWYSEHGVIPGSLIFLSPGKKPGEVVINTDNRRTTRDWVRCALVNSENQLTFAMLKQVVSSGFDDRMVVYIPDEAAIAKLWSEGRNLRGSLEKQLFNILHELSKLIPQGHVHAQELYASINVLRRCPPGPILSVLINHPRITHLGDLYFRMTDTTEEGA